eukprot:m.51423 g.51423  ORF g.51423 m.51423 type:complete len:522 (+) comp34137_c0_seq5:146-1711(+)
MSTARLQPKGHSGFLTKRGGQFKNWKRRWFQIKGDVLFYYKTPTDTQESGYIPLAGNQVLRHPVDPKTPDRHMFEIASVDKRLLVHHHESFLLYADSIGEMETWIGIINRIIREPNGGGMFGRSLGQTMREEAKHFGKGFVPVVVEKCISFLTERGLKEVGIFRLPGHQVRVNTLKESFDKGENPEISASEDIHTIASLLKLYLRVLPEPLIPFEYCDMFIGAARVLEKNEDKGVQQVVKQYEFLPKANFNLLKYLCRFLNEIQTHSDENKMNLGNLATVFGPHFLRPQSEDPQSLMESTSLMALLTKSMIKRHDIIFPQTEDELAFSKRNVGRKPDNVAYKEKDTVIIKHSHTLGSRATMQDVLFFEEHHSEDVAFRTEFRNRKGSAPSSAGSFVSTASGDMGEGQFPKIKEELENSKSPVGRTEAFVAGSANTDLEERVSQLEALLIEERTLQRNVKAELEQERNARQKAEADLERERKTRQVWETRYKQEMLHRQEADRRCSDLRDQLDSFCTSLSSN